jgi:glycosyltransferase involved in cell wall biosynthesis
VKGWQWAVEAARRTERKVVIAGGWRPVVSRWVRFAGTVDGAKKSALLAEARLLWAPAQWDEPFGLTSIEALASGTPVLGTRRGALPEIVTPETGACGDTLEDLIALIPSVARCDPGACRDLVERKFHYRVMAEAYVGIYHSVG